MRNLINWTTFYAWEGLAAEMQLENSLSPTLQKNNEFCVISKAKKMRNLDQSPTQKKKK